MGNHITFDGMLSRVVYLFVCPATVTLFSCRTEDEITTGGINLNMIRKQLAVTLTSVVTLMGGDIY